MTWLLLGLLLFLGVHSVRIVADPWRKAMIARLGEGPWKGAYSLASAVGLVLVVMGYAATREAPVALWDPPVWTRHVAALLMLASMVLLVAAYVPRNALKARLGHPMVLAVKAWALAHLLANGTLADVVLFGAFLAWAVADFVAAKRRDRAAGTVYATGTPSRTAVAVLGGVALWAVLAFWGHAMLFGVRPFA